MKNLAYASALAVSLLSTAVSAQTIAISPGLPNWKELKFDGLTPNRWRAEADALVVEGDRSVSVLYQRVRIDPQATPILSWVWRVDQGPPATDLSRKGGDDRPVSLTIGFAYDSANASLGESMKRMMVETVAGADAPGRVIDLVWGGTAPVGQTFRSAYSGESGRLHVMQDSAAPGTWVEERIDIAALYRAAWGTAPPPITQIAISSDGDDTGSAVRAQVKAIRFSAQ